MAEALRTDCDGSKLFMQTVNAERGVSGVLFVTTACWVRLNIYLSQYPISGSGQQWLLSGKAQEQDEYVCSLPSILS